MPDVTDNVLMHAAQVVAKCLDRGSGPADVMAAMPALRREPSRVRAQVVRLAMAVIAGRRRLRYALGDRRPRDPLQRARAYLMLALIEAGVRVPADARDLPSEQVMRERLLAIADAGERMAVEYSVPDWLLPHFEEAFGEQCGAVLGALAEPAPRTLRANRLRVADRAELIDRLAAEGVEAVPGRYAPDAVHVVGTEDLFQTSAYRDGCFEQQDEASQLAIAATAPAPGSRALDLCCGSGGKTLGLAASLGNRGAILACDVHAARVQELRGRLARAGADNVRPLHLDGGPAAERALAEFARRADRILVDAPCSGTGSWRRRQQARWQVDEAGFAELQATQWMLLQRAAGWLKEGARLVYATCSLLPAENERQLERLREHAPDLEVVRLKEVLGGEVADPITDATGTWLRVRPDQQGCDGFFLGVLRRKNA